MITWDTAKQGTDEWLDARMGLLTASNFKAACSKGAMRDTLLKRLASEAAWGARDDSYQSAAMARGTELEPQARANFELETGLYVAEVGLATNSDLPGLGASLDGLIGKFDGIEIKCPMASTMVDYHKAGKLPAAYKEQVYGQMLVCELELVHFFAWHPQCPPLHVIVTRDNTVIAGLASKLADFTSDLNDIIEKLPR
jgi:exodeoxyribonuclease (lambda-induced)